LIQIDFGWRAKVRSLQHLRMGGAVVTFIWSFPAHNDVNVGAKGLAEGKAEPPILRFVAAMQEGQFGFKFSGCLLRDSKSSYICNSGRALRPRQRAPGEQLAQ
jgi:hypothetical protein